MDGKTMNNEDNTEKMHELPQEKAFLYWIPSILVAIGMFITLLCSFWKFHKRKMFIRQLQIEYMEVNLAAKRPRIGAIHCNTHGAKWEDLMASLSTSGFPNLKPYFRQSSKVVTPRQYDTLYEENDETQETKPLASTINNPNVFIETENKSTGLNLYYEQTGNIQSDTRTKKVSSKKKKKKKTRLNLFGEAPHNTANADNSEYPIIASPRRLPVMENQLWAGYSPDIYSISNGRQLPSIYYARSYIHSKETDRRSPSPKMAQAEYRHSHKESKHRRKEHPKHTQEERVFWVLAADIKQSAV